ncbi:phox domain-containing partial [Plasmopara halstedii]|uniref:Phox domain-containing partial n=1 Tax=Plasmopara halstedii TaxID=4781 RepID=A0A0P1A5Z0_PLAHL|nr:phox domain-containing partial [Plasmopara halstedii]CEG35553.1 phox domain-containing partial [Plasmopara halstedii]
MGILDVSEMNPETYETITQAWIWSNKKQQIPVSTSTTTRTNSLKRRSNAQRALRKSCSERPLTSPQLGLELLSTTASANILDTETREFLNENEEERRQRITARAEEILRGKRCVGMLLGTTCPVCLMDDVDTQLSECGHLIHAKCIKRWIQSGTCCPVCRKEVFNVDQAFRSPVKELHTMTKDYRTSSSQTTELPEDIDQGYDWGWFEDFEEIDDFSDISERNGMLYSSRRSFPTFPVSTTQMVQKDLSSNFDMCRTFPPLHEIYDTPYHQSQYSWLRVLPSHRHIAAKIQIRSFRIVEVKDSKVQHAEYLIEMQLDGRYFSGWRRFSDISRFVHTLDQNRYRQTLAAWQPLVSSSRWFNRLELSYLHKRCRLLEQFAHALLIECSNANPLAELLEC